MKGKETEKEKEWKGKGRRVKGKGERVKGKRRERNVEGREN